MQSPKGISIISAVKAANVKSMVALPDIVTCDSILRPVMNDPKIQLVKVCKEDEGVSICAALSYCEKRAVLLMQHTGFLDSINSIRAIAVEYGLPVVMLVGLQGMEDDRHPETSGQYGIQILKPICEAMKLEYRFISRESDVVGITGVIDQAYKQSAPTVLFIARSL